MPFTALPRILVVDDQRSLRELLRAGLHRLGFREVDEAPDGEAALRAMAAYPPAIIVSDVTMPKLDGLGLLRAVRTNPATALTPFILFSSRADTALVRRAIQFGANGFMTKPFSITDLRARIEAVLGPSA